MIDAQLNAQSITAGSTSGTTAPAQGTIETWTVSALPAAVLALAPGMSYTMVDATPGRSTSQEAEVIRVITCAGPGATSVQVIRGDDGTTPVAHATGSVFNVISVASFLNTGDELAYAEVAGASITTQMSGSLVYTQISGSGIVVPACSRPVWIEYQGTLAVSGTTGAGAAYVGLLETTSGSNVVMDTAGRAFVGTNSGSASKLIGVVRSSKRIGPTTAPRTFVLAGTQLPDTGTPTTQVQNTVSNPTWIAAFMQ